MKRTRLARTFVLLLTLGCVASAFASSEASVEIARKTVESASLSRTVMNVEFDQFQVSTQATLAASVQELTFATSLLVINGTGTPVAHVTHYELGELVSPSFDESSLPNSPDELVLVDRPVIMSGVRLSGASVWPLMRTPEGVREVLSVQYEVVTQGAGGENQVLHRRPVPWEVLNVLHRTTDNLDDINEFTALNTPGRYLIIGSTALLNQSLASNSQYQAWLETKRQKGFNLQIVTLRDIAVAQGDSSANSIREYISNTYHDETLPPLVYAVIIGDMNGSFGVATRLVTNPEATDDTSVGDDFFFTVDGDDYITDVFYGRISAQSVSEFVQYFRKAFLYEIEPYRDDPQWFHSITCVAGNFADGGTYPVTPVWNMNWARDYVMAADNCITDADTFYFHTSADDPSEWTEEIIADINEGVCAIWYRGWGNSSGWAYPVFTVGELPQINVGRKFPAIWGVVCGSGNYGYGSGQCFGERWTTGMGGGLNPNGAIVYYGASDLHTNTKHNNAMLAAMCEGMIIEGVRSTGALAQAGKMEVYRQYPLERDLNGLVHYYGFHVFNILGDPEIPLYFCEPSDLVVDVQENLEHGTGIIHVNVTNQQTGLPVENAIVALRRDPGEEATTVATNAAGDAWIPAYLVGRGRVELTVWKHSYFLKQQYLNVASLPRDPWVGSINYNAGADNMPNPGENVGLTFQVYNNGSASASWSVVATSLDTLTTISNGNATLPTLAPEAGAVTSEITLQINPRAWPNSQPAIQLAFTDGAETINREVRFAVGAPDPMIVTLDVQDADGYLSPGETANISVTVRNIGTLDASALSATVSSFDNAITFPDNALDWSNVQVGEDVVSTTTFSATVPAGVTRGRQVALRFVFSWNGAPFTWKQHMFTIGEVTPNVPTGPDGYGYYAYENTDAGFSATPTYAWQELDPDFGGSGGEAHVVRDDTHFIMELPQPFTFYGQEFDTISVCSNGWISFGATDIPEFRNWEIPSPIGPTNMVCAMWGRLDFERRLCASQ
jgi:hypothetical protein